ncbi:MAG: Eco57I restriction-modification methylase domain-containing protein [Candidatus Heimdallarchaeota archaeon]|nr:Eco57I restriction-modification methylase domain-containing protein [Candidatus Heimdallarchaeota archaeon]
MNKKRSKEFSVFDQFIEKYLSLENHLMKNQVNFTSTQFHEIYYLLVKIALINKFQINFLIDDDEYLHLNSVKENLNDNFLLFCTQLINDNLVSHFNFSLLENSLTNDYITPYIFSLLFEISLQHETKQKSGSYYTSYSEVNYMCSEALYYHLSGFTKIAKSKLCHILWGQENFDHLGLTDDEIKTLLTKINEIRIMDPACGSGAFILGFIQLLSRLAQELAKLLNAPFDQEKVIQQLIQKNLYGLDINCEALAVAKLRLNAYMLANDIKLERNFPNNLFQSNTLIEDFKTISNNNVLLFDIVIGNPPYIRQEQFTISNDSQKSIDDYKSLIIDSLEDFLDNRIIIPRNRKSDFYIFFFYRALSLLKENGIICFITSNSWLDAKFGNNFKKILLENFILNSIQTNNYSKSFSSAINTVIVLLTKKMDAHTSDYCNVRFELFRKPIDEMIKSNLTVFISQKISNKSTNEIEVLQIPQKNLYANITNKKSYKNKWGAYYFKLPKKIANILEINQDKFTTLDSLGKLRYPIKTGLNDFFIVDKETILKFSIESEFLVQLLKSPKKISAYNISEDSLKYKLFICDKSKEFLRNEKKMGALKYIEWGEKQLTRAKQQTKAGISWSKVPSVKAHKPYWYTLPKIPPADIFCVRFFDRRFFFCYSDSEIIEDQTFYGFLLKKSMKKYKVLLLGILNSTLNYILLEIFGRTALGKGALQYSINDYKILPLINPYVIPKNLHEEIIQKTESLLNNDINSLFTELKIKDRLDLDKLFFNWLGINESEIEEIYRIAVDLVNNRLRKSGQKI